MNSSEKHNPIVRKRASFPFPIAIVCWIDLLGYGAMIAEAGFNPLHSKASKAMRRLRRFHEIVASHSIRLFPTLVLNDGAVAYRDLSLRSRGPTYDFLTRAWNLFSNIKNDEAAQGLPGARVVVAPGFRMRGRRAGMDATASHYKSLMRRYQEGVLSAEQALREAANIRQSFDIIPQLQANFAFTKAYLAESAGTKAGFQGANFFVDLIIFDTPTPPWVVRGKTVNWSHERLRMEGSFAQILDFPRHKHVSGGPVGIRDGLEIAQQLTQDPTVLDALRAAHKPK
ncbi:MAG: hypothetical protein L0387_10445 [Acidobacteria bacterium]|nr:hypothetical protein [Acidobacteriota bacterium]